ncbi:hypothetical protein [Advenella sp. FME57]|nr:hypothetical protein [Advenella sp. FME57]
MKITNLTRTVILVCLGIFGSMVNANTLVTPSAAAGTDPGPIAKSEETFLAGTFSGDDIELKLDAKGRFVLSGGAVGKSLHGNWTMEKSGLHTLLRLSVDKKNEDDWLFGIRSRNTLQAVNEGKLKVLDRPLDINEDSGVLTRVK